ncbi:MAG: hypothetical protein DMG41_36460 [Acidobacteria bacterium]|nr:MAG: hypothetical protein DMG41_36460 [Acidobacteriota bacterium]
MPKFKCAGFQCGKFKIPMPDDTPLIINQENVVESLQDSLRQIDNNPEADRAKVLEDIPRPAAIDE